MSAPASFAKFAEWVSDPTFLPRLAEAAANPHLQTSTTTTTDQVSILTNFMFLIFLFLFPASDITLVPTTTSLIICIIHPLAAKQRAAYHLHLQQTHVRQCLIETFKIFH